MVNYGGKLGDNRIICYELFLVLCIVIKPDEQLFRSDYEVH